MTNFRLRGCIPVASHWQRGVRTPSIYRLWLCSKRVLPEYVSATCPRQKISIYVSVVHVHSLAAPCWIFNVCDHHHHHQNAGFIVAHNNVNYCWGTLHSQVTCWLQKIVWTWQSWAVDRSCRGTVQYEVMAAERSRRDDVVKQLLGLPRFQILLLIVYDHIIPFARLFSDYLGKTNSDNSVGWA